jgi:uncharacterized GH25 family protein
MRAVSFLVFLVLASPALGHYHILLPESWSVKKDEATTLQLTFGHPFEHQLFDCGAEEEFWVCAPGSDPVRETGLKEMQVAGVDGKKVAAWQLPFKPTVRGDYVFMARLTPVWMEEEGEFWVDTVRVTLHVQAQKGWDTKLSFPGLSCEPLTRPYGLLPGQVFQARFHKARNGDPLANTLVEVERYNATAPKTLPPDEFITRTLKTDVNGVATTTLPEAGWWALTASRMTGQTYSRAGKVGPLRERSTLWVYVSAAPK